MEVMHAPGHSPGHVVIHGGGIALVGDCLFAGSIGRTDLPFSNPAACVSLKKISNLAPETVVYPGHGIQTTIGQERLSNPFLNGTARIVGHALKQTWSEKTRTEKDPLGGSLKFVGRFVRRADPACSAELSDQWDCVRCPRSSMRLCTPHVPPRWTHKETGRLEPRLADAIVKATDEVLAGVHRDHFVVDVYQAGAGTSHNMNVNEVLANRANEILGGKRGG